MKEGSYFQKALSDFMFESASGGAIRHLVDHGYTVDQIRKKLDFPTPLDRIQQTVWDHMLEREILTFEEPGSKKQKEKVDYVMEFNEYGRRSFRQVSVPCEEPKVPVWSEHAYSELDGALSAFLAEKCRQNGEEKAYISCDFGLRSRREPKHFAEMLKFLDEQQRNYVEGIPWERRMVYHRLDKRMREIVCRLYEQGEYHGFCYFINLEEKVKI